MIETRLDGRSKNVVDRIKKTLNKYDIEIARVEAEIALYNEIINLKSNSSKKADLKALTEAKIYKENNEVFLRCLKGFKMSMITKINLVASKYDKQYSCVFIKYFINDMSIEEIAKDLDTKKEVIENVVAKMRDDIVDYLEK